MFPPFRIRLHNLYSINTTARTRQMCVRRSHGWVKRQTYRQRSSQRFRVRYAHVHALVATDAPIRSTRRDTVYRPKSFSTASVWFSNAAAALSHPRRSPVRMSWTSISIFSLPAKRAGVNRPAILSPCILNNAATRAEHLLAAARFAGQQYSKRSHRSAYPIKPAYARQRLHSRLLEQNQAACLVARWGESNTSLRRRLGKEFARRGTPDAR